MNKGTSTITNTVLDNTVNLTIKDLSASDISGIHFYTLDRKVDINGTKSVFTDISASDISGMHFYTLDRKVDINGTKSVFTDISGSEM